ncbi:MAG: hypothetical protein PHW73_01110 [Atribacterota bacterium]|nr:hypothetical protein [Atribacterota bacterium]
MIAFRPYSCVSQIITVNNKWICFDEKAAEQLEHEIHSRALIDSLNNILFESYDTLIVQKDRQIDTMNVMIKRVEKDNLSLRSLMSTNEYQYKSERKWYLALGVTSGAIVTILITILFNR